MNARTWILLNVALFVLAGIGVGSIVSLPKELREQKAQTARAISGKEEENAANAARTNRNLVRKGTARNTAAEEKADTWPAIRRGSLADTWQKTLFNKERRELSAVEENDSQNQQAEEELPAPPNFELIGILRANDCAVAIIELKNASQRNAGRPMGARMVGGRPVPQPANQRAQDAKTADSASFEPSFVTAHEGDMLQETGYKLAVIRVDEKAVILTKDGLEYKLKLEKNSANAAKRRDSQNTYAQTLQDKARAASANAATARQTQQAQAAQQQANQQQANQQQANQPRQFQRTAAPVSPPMPPGMQQNGNWGGQAQNFPQNNNNGAQPNANWQNNGRFQRFGGTANQPANQQ